MTRKSFDKDELIRGTRIVIMNRSGGRCEYTDERGMRCGRLITWETGEMSHLIPRGRLERLGGLRMAYHPKAVKWTCPEHNAAVLLGRGVAEDQLIKAIEADLSYVRSEDAL